MKFSLEKKFSKSKCFLIYKNNFSFESEMKFSLEKKFSKSKCFLIYKNNFQKSKFKESIKKTQFNEFSNNFFKKIKIFLYLLLVFCIFRGYKSFEVCIYTDIQRIRIYHQYQIHLKFLWSYEVL